MPYRSLFAQRRLEWWLAAYTMGWGVLLFAWPGALDDRLHVIARIWAPSEVWGFAAVVLAMFHAWALWINGRAHWSAYVRAAATVCIAAFFTLLLSAVLAAMYYKVAPVSASAAAYAAPVWASVCAFWVAALDSCVSRRRRAHGA